MSLIYVNVSCHCGANKFKVTFDIASLPVQADTCHCNSCRHSSGQMGYCVARFQGAPMAHSSESNELADVSRLSQYQCSDAAVRLFCGTCSAHMFWHYIGTDPHWSVAVGSLGRVEGLFSMSFHIFVPDTLDGGLADHYRSVNGVELSRYIGHEKDVVPVGWKSDVLKNEKKDGPLTLHCHCQANVFHITRPKEISNKSQQWWLFQASEREPVKFHTGHCVCNSCRLTSGQEIQSWAMVSRENVIDPSTLAPIDFWDDSKRPKNLTRYISTPEKGISREFCGTCGATFFYWTRDQQDMVHVSVGVVDETQAGARAETWFHWHNEVINAEFGLNRQMVKDLGEGLKMLC
ncbi:Mss4-like protein [Cyathus striatus]|nr:Mss4-like protein [Cyathus striatus]